MKTPLSAVDIEVLMFLSYSAEPHPRREAPAVAQSIAMWRGAGMIEESGNDDQWEVTDKGWKMIDMLKHTPCPVQAWSDPRDVNLPIQQAVPKIEESDIYKSILSLRTEVNCRIEHGALLVGGHLKYVEKRLDAILQELNTTKG